MEHAPSLFTVGHSNHALEHFLSLLERYRIEALADVRSSPFSRQFPQFNTNELKVILKSQEIAYVPMGEQLGGRPREERLYDAEGHANYRLMARTELFLGGLERLKRGIERYRVAIMCSEENPNECHRRLLVVRALCEQDPAYEDEIVHIRRDGRLEPERELQNLERTQMNWFEEVSQLWRSPKPIRLVSPEKPHKTSSAY
jgi:uncharacterized protein (DUF488 family)